MKCAQAICVLFILVNLLLSPKNSFSQATARFGVEALAPMGDWQDQYFAGAGVDFSLDYFLTNKFSLGVNSGFNYLFVQKKIIDNVDKHFDYLIPFYFQSKYFLIGNLKEEGLIAQLQAGYSELYVEREYMRAKTKQSVSDPSISIGIGYQNDRQLQYFLKYNTTLSAFDRSYLSFNLAFKFF